MEQSTAPAVTRARLTIDFPEVTDQPSENVFITEEAFQKYSAIPQLLAAQEELAKGRSNSAAPDGRWMPDVDASFVPFTHPAKQRKLSASFISDSSNATKQSQGVRTEGNGSNEREDAAGFQNSPNTEGLEQQLEGVGGSSFAASHVSHETAGLSKHSEQHLIQNQDPGPQPQLHVRPGKAMHAKAKPSANEPASDDAAANIRRKIAQAKVPKPLTAQQAGTQQGEELQDPPQQEPKARALPTAWSKDLAKGIVAVHLSGPPKRPPPAQAEASAIRMSAAEAARLTARTSADLSAHGFLHTPLRAKKPSPGSPGAKAARLLHPRGTSAAPGRGERTAPEASAVEEITPKGEAPSKRPAARAGAGRLVTGLSKSGAGTTARGRGAGRRGRGRGRSRVQAGLAGSAQAVEAASERQRQLTANTGEGAELASLQLASPAAEDDDELGDALWADLREGSPSNSATVEAAGCPAAASPGTAAPAPAGGGPGPASRGAAEAATTTAGSRAASVSMEPAHKTTLSRQDSTQALALLPDAGRAIKLPTREQGSSPTAQPSQETWLTAEEEPIGPAELRRWEEEVSRRKHKMQRLHQEGDLVRRVTPVFDPVLNAEIRALQKCKGPLADEEGRLLSGLTRRQHAWYQTPPAMRPRGQEMANLEDLELSVMEEQRVHMKAATRLGLATHREDLLHCKPPAQAQFEVDSAAKRPRVESFPQHYRLHTTCALDKVRFSQEPLQLLHVRHLSLPSAPGILPTFIPVRWRHVFPLEQQFIPATATGEADRATAFPFRKAATEQLSKSTSVLNALEAEAEDADAAVPSTTLNTLTGLLEEEFGPAWEIPIVVRNRPSGRKVVIMEKALHSRASSLREKHTRLYKWALLSTGLSGGGHAGSPGPAAAAQSTPSATAAGAAAAGTTDTPAGESAGPSGGPVRGIYPRPERLDVWQVGRHKLLVRSHDTAVLGKAPAVEAQAAGSDAVAAEQDEPASPSRPATARPVSSAATAPAASPAMDVSGGGSPVAARRRASAAAAKEAVGKPVVVRARAEYHAQRYSQGELTTHAELARLWLASHLRLGAPVWVARVHVGNNRLLQGAQLLTSARLNADATRKGIPQHFAAWLALLLEELQQLRPGTYLMTHARTSCSISFYQAITNPLYKVATKPLPLKGGPVLDAGACYDLWAAHRTSGAVDTENLDYIPLNWVAPDPTIPHIPFTFVPRPNIPHRKRQRKLQPSFVTKHHGEDWDTIVDSEGVSGRADPNADMYGEL